MNQLSAGLLLFRRYTGEIEVFLAHPGGPFWKNKDGGAWTIPKGLVGEGETPLDAAVREFREETGLTSTGPFFELGQVRQKAGKIIHAWATEGDADPAKVTSNTFVMEFPLGSGRRLEVPEVDRCEWFTLSDARAKINPAQAVLIDRLREILERPD